MAETVSDEVIDYYQGRCVSCWVEPSVTIHHIVPRSKRPADYDEFDNLAPLCHSCHDLIHRAVVSSTGWVRQNRKRLVQLLYGDQAPPIRTPHGITNPVP